MYLIIGASGFIGSHLYSFCKAQRIDVVGTYCKHRCNSEYIPFDICLDNLNDICIQHLGGIVPAAVIICGANAGIDSCKRNEIASNLLNVIGTKRLIDQISKIGSKTVFISSETVFDGKKGMYTEDDSPKPITLYGRQKLQIEQYLIHQSKEYIIFRISRAVGSCFGENDIFGEFYCKIMHQEEIVCLKNQTFCITEIGDIVRGMIKAIDLGLNGLYHLSSANYITRYELARLYAKTIFGEYSKIFEREYCEMNFLDKRHIYGGLNGNKLAGILQMKYMDTAGILKNYLDSYQRKEVFR